MKSALLSLLLLFFAGPLLAGDLAGITLPDQITLEGKTLLLNGMGLREATFLKVDVYVAGLYLEKKSSDPAAILASGEAKRLVMKFVRKVSREELVKAWTEAFDKNAAKELPALKDRLSTLNSWMADVSSGDTLIFTEIPDQGVKVEVKGQERGTLPGADFARALWSVWLGASPPNPGLKTGLLGKS